MASGGHLPHCWEQRRLGWGGDEGHTLLPILLHEWTSVTSVEPALGLLQGHEPQPGHPATPTSFLELDAGKAAGPAQKAPNAHQLLLVKTCLPQGKGTVCICSFIHSLITS